MRINKKHTNVEIVTAQGAPAQRVSPSEQLRRCVMAGMLWEDGFYIDGKTQSEIIVELCDKCTAAQIADIMVCAHVQYRLRHMPLLLALQLLKKTKGKTLGIGHGIASILTRPDQMTELLALYWKDGRKCVPRQMKLAFQIAFKKFDEYQLQKYNRDHAVKLRDVLRLAHIKPDNAAQSDLWKRLIAGQLKTPDTWETRLSSGESKALAFGELLAQNKMGALAILRNMRNMRDGGIAEETVALAFNRKPMPLLPFQYIAAAAEVPQWERTIDNAMIASMAQMAKLPGTTMVFVDVSGSMGGLISSKSKMTRRDAASGMAILLDGVCDRLQVYSFSNALALVPPRRGMALRDAIEKSQPPSDTYLGLALTAFMGFNIPFDRMIIITDEQVADKLPRIPGDKNYILNVGTSQNGVKHNDDFLVITGFSHASIDYIREIENERTESHKLDFPVPELLANDGENTFETNQTQWGY